MRLIEIRNVVSLFGIIIHDYYIVSSYIAAVSTVIVNIYALVRCWNHTTGRPVPL